MAPASSRSYAFQICLLFPLATIMFFVEYRAFSVPVQNMNRSLRAHPGSALVAYQGVDEQRSATVTPTKKKKTLPMMSETGGLIVFLHVAKSGGTTIRQDFSDDENFPYVNVKRVYGVEQVKLMKNEIDWHLSKENSDKKTMLLEIHGGHGQPMTIFEIHNYIQTWRKQAAASGKNVFVFTLFREPTHFYVSYFNFFKHPGCNFRWCDRPSMPLTEDNLLSSMIPNHQCLYLTRKWDKEYNKEHPVTFAECKSAYQLLQADADWVSTTESMQRTTLPLLSYMLTGNAETGKTLKPQNTNKKDPKNLSVKDLSPAAVESIRQRSTMDHFLYERAAADYTLDMWENYNDFDTTMTTAKLHK